MIPEIGQFALALALCMALLQGLLPLAAGSSAGGAGWRALAVPACRAQALFLAVAFACLSWSFIAHDFSVAYVAQNSNSRLPLFYRISAVWGGHEGSILLWALVLAGWTMAVSFFSKTLPEVFRARVLAVMGLISAGFLLFILATSSPFDRLVPALAEGNDLNPLLQDPGMIVHPPLLYMGYVGLAVPFAFAIAALIDGRVDAAWTRWTRPWTTVAWLFLTLGIALGSWWAYYELGWGGWWFWDPVENASFMPWLVATALIHSQAVTEQRGGFRAWTVLLAICGFSLSLLGTFLVRSGVLISVHAFATDPERGVFILAFLSLVVGGALVLFVWRGARVSGGGANELFSRETLLLVNNVLLVVASASVLLGTLYPLLMDALGVGKISVGPPYFNAVFVPLMLPLALLVGLGPMVRWKRDDARRHLRRLWPLFAGALAIALVWVALAPSPRWWLTAAGLGSGLWIVAATLFMVIDRVRSARGQGAGARRLRPAFLGMCIAHLGFAVSVLGITGVSAWNQETDLRMVSGGSYEYAGYTFRFGEVTRVQGPNYVARRAHVSVLSDGEEVALLTPEKRTYLAQEQPMTDASIDWSLARDVFVALGDAVGEGAWAVRVQVKPFIRLIWLGPLIMAIGGLLAVCDRRYRVPLRAPLPVAPRPDAEPGAAGAAAG
jgi:cytochrome c-type biogenesis protein CcmF